MADEGTNHTAQVAYAQLVFRDGLPLDMSGYVADALQPGTRVTRYGREWIMGATTRRGGFIHGRLGYQRAGTPNEVYSDSAKDFVEEEVLTGKATPFAVRTSDMLIAYQLRPGITRQGFAGALQSLMRETSDFPWRIEQMRRRMPFEEWRSQVDRVMHLDVTLRRPNPHYADREEVEKIIEGSGARMVRLILDAPEGTSLDVDGTFLRQAIEHTESYGKFSATGERTEAGRTVKVRWSEQDGAEVPTGTAAVGDNGEVERDALVAELPQESTEED